MNKIRSNHLFSGVLSLNENPLNWTVHQVESIASHFDKAQLIGLGETIHGTQKIGLSDFVLVRHLIENKKIRLVFMESNVFESEGITEWVQSGQGVIEKEIQNLHFPSEESLLLFKFMREWNINHPQDKVQFIPVDIYIWPWIEHEKLRQTLEKLNLKIDINDFIRALDEAKAQCYGHNIQLIDKKSGIEEFNQMRAELKTQNMDVIRFQNSMKLLENLRIEFFLKRKNEILNFISLKEYSDSVVRLQSLWARQRHMKGWSDDPVNFSLLWNSRDEMMANNLLSRWEHYGLNKKAVFLAHSSHVCKKAEMADWWNMGFGKIKSAGQFLNQKLGDTYKTVATSGYKMEGIQGDFLAPISENSLDLKLHNEGHMSAAIRADDPSLSKEKKWYIENENSKETGSNGVLLNLAEQFDVILFFDKSHVSRSIPKLDQISN